MNINSLSTLGAHRQMLVNQQLLQIGLRQLSSGQRINRAADDASGLAISEMMRSQQTIYSRSIQNAQDGVSLAQTGDGALSTVHSLLDRLTDLSAQAANGILGAEERGVLNNEAQDLLKEIDRISGATNFNGKPLLDGSLSGPNQLSISGVASSSVADSQLIGRQDFTVYDGTNGSDATFNVNGKSFLLADAANYADAVTQYAGSGVHVVQTDGTNGASLTATDMENLASAIQSDTGLGFSAVAGGVAMEVGKGLDLQVGEGESINVSIGNMSAGGLGLSGLDLSTQSGAMKALDLISNARESVSSARGSLGATQNRLESTINNLGVSYENITAAESRIRDLDMARGMMDFTKRSLLSQSSMSMLAQGNAMKYQVLQLLR